MKYIFVSGAPGTTLNIRAFCNNSSGEIKFYDRTQGC